MATTVRRVIYAGSFDPPSKYHRAIVELLAETFDDVVVVPNGPRPDRPEAESYPVHRAVMADLNFRTLPNVTVDLTDLEQARYTPNSEFERRYGGPGVTLSHVVPVSAILPTPGGTKSRVRAEWGGGEELWHTAHFTILCEPGEAVTDLELPPNLLVLKVPPHQTTATIRANLYDGLGSHGLLVPSVEDYIKRHGLFRPTPPAPNTHVDLPCPPKVRLVVDPRNFEAVELAEQFRQFESDTPDVVIVVGGDGTMLRAIRQHWRDRVPFYGLNTGQLGFLLNTRDPAKFWERPLKLYQLPLLYVGLSRPDGGTEQALAFNDAWVERDTGQTAWIEVSVNGKVRLPRVVADGMLIATAAGSTSYARAMGATPLPLNASLLTLAGSNVLKPEFWHPAVLTHESEVTVRSLDHAKRPLQGFVDGVDFGRVETMTARVSRIAAVELLFAPAYDPVAKLALLQFPQPGC